MSARSWMLPIAMVAGGSYAGKSIAIAQGGNENDGAALGAGAAIIASLALHSAGAGIRALLKPAEHAAAAAARDGAVPETLATAAKAKPAMSADEFLIRRKIEVMRYGRLL